MRIYLLAAVAVFGCRKAATRPPAPVTEAPALTADEVVAKVQAFYAGIDRVTARFIWEIHNVTFGKRVTVEGKVWVQKPGKMRWDYLEPRDNTVQKTLISNGTDLYLVEHQTMQVLEKHLEDNVMPVVVGFVSGHVDLEAFDAAIDTITDLGGPADVVVVLTPRTPTPHYVTLRLVVDPDGHVTRSMLVDAVGSSNDFRFYDPDFEKTVEPSWFELSMDSLPRYELIPADD